MNCKSWITRVPTYQHCEHGYSLQRSHKIRIKTKLCLQRLHWPIKIWFIYLPKESFIQFQPPTSLCRSWRFQRQNWFRTMHRRRYTFTMPSGLCYFRWQFQVNISAGYLHQRTPTIGWSIAVQLTSCLTGLDLTEQVKLFFIQHKQSSWI